MRRPVTILALVLATPTLALAHVSVRPRESKPNVEERYTVRVPTEGAVATTHVILEIPAGVTVLEVLPHEGATFETVKQGDRITAITWKKEIPPKGSAEFVFRARNPESGDIVWKAHQHFSDATVADWVGVAGEKRPASVTKLTAAASAGPGQSAPNDALSVEAWLKGYDAPRWVSARSIRVGSRRSCCSRTLQEIGRSDIPTRRVARHEGPPVKRADRAAGIRN